MPNYAVYKDRLDALCTSAKKMADHFEKGAAFDRRPTVVEMLRRLSDFARIHFDFFFERLALGKKEPELTSSPDYPPESAFFAIVTQVARDLEVISLAGFQRLHADDLMLAKLNRADQLSYKALQHTFDSFLKRDHTVEPQTALSYFQKVPAIRVLPYAPVAIVGIPFASLGSDEDLLAIPHEIGHYVFWHGNQTGFVKPEKPLRQEVWGWFDDASPKFNPAYKDWAEELFADVYGCMVAQERIAHDFQELTRANADKKFFKNDGEHPIPLIRPRIYHRVLEKLGTDAPPNLNLSAQRKKACADAAIQLRNEWDVEEQKRLQTKRVEIAATSEDRGRITFELVPTESRTAARTRATKVTDFPTTRKNVMDTVDAVVDAVYALLKDKMQLPDQDWLSDNTPIDLRQNGDVKTSYPDYLNDNAVDGNTDYEQMPKPGRSGQYAATTWRLWVFANGWTDGPNGPPNVGP
jgi:hypothetical protein